MKNRRVQLIGLLLIVGVAAGVVAPRAWRWWTAPPAGYCPFCLRHEHKESVVKFRADGGRVTDACCLSCALNYGRQMHKAVTIVSVTDHESGQPIDPKTATFVVGSDVTPCTHVHEAMRVGPQREAFPVRWDRCLPSILAFPSTAAADTFRAQHGGRVRTLEELMKQAEASSEPLR
ncbi:MAG: NosL [Deltaproteobacteria bacterium]|nr:NosL [Deltaproteobacteria bacterium]